MRQIYFNSWTEQWLKSHKDFIKESTFRTFELHYKNHIKQYFNNVFLKDVNNKEIQEFIIFLYSNGRVDGKGGLSVSTIKDIVLVIKLSLKYAFEENKLKQFEFNIKYPQQNKPDTVQVLSLSDEKKLISAIYLNLNNKTVGFMLSFLCSLRIGELCALKWGDIDFEEKTININKTLQRVYIKDKNKTKIIVTSPKTKSSNRVIPIPEQLVLILKKIQGKENYYVLTNSIKYTEPKTYRRYFNNFMKKNNLPKIKFHSLRHTFAIRAIEMPEFDIKSLAYVMGHKNPSFTLNVYGRQNSQQTKKCMNLFNELL